MNAKTIAIIKAAIMSDTGMTGNAKAYILKLLETPEENWQLSDPETKTEVKGDRVVSYKEAAYRLGGVTTKTVWEFGRRGYLKFVRPYGLRKALGVTESSLAAFIAGQSPVDLTKRGRRGRHKGSGTELHTAKSRNWNEAHKEAANENRD